MPGALLSRAKSHADLLPPGRYQACASAGAGSSGPARSTLRRCAGFRARGRVDDGGMARERQDLSCRRARRPCAPRALSPKVIILIVIASLISPTAKLA